MPRDPFYRAAHSNEPPPLSQLTQVAGPHTQRTTFDERPTPFYSNLQFALT